MLIDNYLAFLVFNILKRQNIWQVGGTKIASRVTLGEMTPGPRVDSGKQRNLATKCTEFT
jgi:hypothetical protein